MLQFSSLTALELLLLAKQIHVRYPWILFSKQPPGKEIVLSVSFITNPLKARLFLALVQESRPFYITLYVMFSFHYNKVLHLLVVIWVLYLRVHIALKSHGISAAMTW